jgi:predicted RNase H-like HicB family nuclease
MFSMDFEIVFDREDDGRWIGETESPPEVLAYGSTQMEAQSKVEALAPRVVADR